jgi:hypothetical protein
MATTESEDRLARVNRVRAELGLAPLTAERVKHDRSLAEASEVRLAGLVDVCATMLSERSD